MSRQPFLPQHKGKHFCFDQRGLEANIDASRLIGQIITDWARAEHQMAMVLAALLGEHPQAGVALFATLRNARAQRDAFQAVADATIADIDTRMILDAVLAFAGSVGKARHDLAHGIFGWSFDLPELTLWIESRHMAEYEAEAWFRFKSGAYDKTVHNHDRLETMIYCYQSADFQDILRDTAEVKQSLFNLYVVLRHNHGATSPEYRQLCSQPRVARELGRLQ